MHKVGCISHIFDTEIGIQQTMACSGEGGPAPVGQLPFCDHILLPFNLYTGTYLQCSGGEAKVYFFNREDAKKAVKIYHNRQLDGKPMKCKIQ